MFKKNYLVKVCLMTAGFILLMPSLIIVLIQQEMVPSSREWSLWVVSLLTIFNFIMVIMAAVIVRGMYLKHDEMLMILENHEPVDGDDPFDKIVFRVIDDIPIFREMNKVNNLLRVLKFENQILYDTALAIHTTASSQEFLDTVVARLTTHLEADFGMIFLQEGELFKLSAKFNISDEEIDKKSFRIGEGFVGWAGHKSQGILSHHVEKDPRYIRYVSGTKSEMVVPIKIYKRVLGVLVLGCREIQRFKESDLKLLQTVSGEIGLAVNNAKLTEKLKKESEYNQILYEATQQIASSVDLESVVNTGIRILEDVIGYKSCTLMTFNKDKNQLEIVAQQGVIDQAVKMVELKGVIGQAFSQKHPIKEVGEDQCLYAIPLLSDDGCIGMIHITTYMVLSHDQYELINSIVAQLSTAIENAVLYQSVENLAIRDGLTSLYNHRYFQEAIEREVKLAEANHHELSLVILDIDNFKKYNDTYGHVVGDYLLQKMSDMIKENMRPEDIVARYGGDELAVILPDTDKVEAHAVMERVKKAIINYKFKAENPTGKKVDEEKDVRKKVIDNDLETTGVLAKYLPMKSKLDKWFSDKRFFNKADKEGSFHITMSAGIASLSDTNYDRLKLIEKADQALLQSKQDGKNKITIWEPQEEVRSR